MNMHRLPRSEQIDLSGYKYKRRKKRALPQAWVMVAFFAVCAFAIFSHAAVQ